MNIRLKFLADYPECAGLLAVKRIQELIFYLLDNAGLCGLY